MSPLQKIGRFFYVTGEKIFMPENRLCPVKHPACPCTEAKGVCPVCDWNHDVFFSSEAARAGAQEAQQYVMRGLTALAAGQKAVAFAELAQALTIRPALQLPMRLAPVYCDRAEAYQDQKQYEQALADYTQAIACDPENIKAYLNRVWFMKIWENLMPSRIIAK